MPPTVHRLPEGWSATIAAFAIAVSLAFDARAQDVAASVAVDVQRNGDAYVATAVLTAPADRSIAWDVLTDFDRMLEFMPNLTSSRILKRVDNRLLVRQSGRMEVGAFNMSWQSDREIDLSPQSVIHSRQVTGNMERVESVANFSEIAGGTRVDYRVEMVPKTWMPESVAMRMLKSSIERQFGAMLNEIMRRKAP